LWSRGELNQTILGRIGSGCSRLVLITVQWNFYQQ
jgi:hypothetical protein